MKILLVSSLLHGDTSQSLRSNDCWSTMNIPAEPHDQRCKFIPGIAWVYTQGHLILKRNQQQKQLKLQVSKSKLLVLPCIWIEEACLMAILEHRIQTGDVVTYERGGPGMQGNAKPTSALSNRRCGGLIADGRFSEVVLMARVVSHGSRSSGWRCDRPLFKKVTRLQLMLSGACCPTYLMRIRATYAPQP